MSGSMLVFIDSGGVASGPFLYDSHHYLRLFIKNYVKTRWCNVSYSSSSDISINKDKRGGREQQKEETST